MNGLAIAGALLLLAGTVDRAASAESDNIEQKARACFACHGPNGASTTGRYPIIAGQQEYYLYVQLRDFQAGRRENVEMTPMAQSLTKEDMQALAKYFSQQAWPGLSGHPDAAKVEAGVAAAAAGQCPQCHLGGYNGNSRVPRLAGMHPEYLEKTMLDFKNRKRNNAADMSALMQSFSDEDIEALAEYLGSLTVHVPMRGSEVD